MRGDAQYFGRKAVCHDIPLHRRHLMSPLTEMNSIEVARREHGDVAECFCRPGTNRKVANPAGVVTPGEA